MKHTAVHPLRGTGACSLPTYSHRWSFLHARIVLPSAGTLRIAVDGQSIQTNNIRVDGATIAYPASFHRIGRQCGRGHQQNCHFFLEFRLM
jgi:hypothetical protein